MNVASLHSYLNAPDLFRIIMVFLCFILIGTNLGFIIHANIVFKTEACRVWRFFFLAKSMITFSLAYLLWSRVTKDQGIVWATWIGGIGVLFSNTALFMLWRIRRKVDSYY